MKTHKKWKKRQKAPRRRLLGSPQKADLNSGAKAPKTGAKAPPARVKHHQGDKIRRQCATLSIVLPRGCPSSGAKALKIGAKARPLGQSGAKAPLL